MIQISRFLLSSGARNSVRAGIYLINVKSLPLYRHYSEKLAAPETKDEVKSEHQDDIPWYLRDDSSSPLVEAKKIELPQLPADAPVSVDKFLNVLAYDYGFDNIKLFDLSLLDDDHNFSTKNQSSRYILIATGKSEKHIYKAGLELRNFIKHTYHVLPSMEGLTSQEMSPLARRRMLKRARKGPLATDNDYGKAANSWVMCDTDVDGVQIHLLTEQRRTELNLEELWCREEDIPLYQRQESEQMQSDDIFIGIRRGFHTLTGFRAYSTTTTQDTSLQQLYNELANEDAEISEQKLLHYKQSFDGEFSGTLEDYNIKLKLYKLIHVCNPKVASFQDLTNALYEKHSSLMITTDPSVDLEMEKVQDIIYYTKLLIDSPELGAIKNNDINEHTTYLFDQLSKFIARIAGFSDINLLSNNEFVALLWRLSFTSKQGFIGSNTIDRAISNGSFEQFDEHTLTSLSTTNARDVFDLLKYHSKSYNKEFSPALKELIIHTYGNSGNWVQFWKKWDTYYGLLNRQQGLENWVRLVVYLAMRNDKSAMIHFLHNYWDQSSSVSGSFISNYKKNGHLFASDDELVPFKHGMSMILNTVKNHENLGNFDQVKTFIESL